MFCRDDEEWLSNRKVMNSLMMKNSNSQFHDPIQRTCLEFCENIGKLLPKNSTEFVEVPDLIERLYSWAVRGINLKYILELFILYLICFKVSSVSHLAMGRFLIRRSIHFFLIFLKLCTSYLNTVLRWCHFPLRWQNVLASKYGRNMKRLHPKFWQWQTDWWNWAFLKNIQLTENAW